MLPLVLKQTVARAHRPPFVRESTLGSSCDKVASLLGSALSLPVTPAQEQSLNCRDHWDHTGQTDLSWARDEWAHFCTGGGHPSLRPGNSVPFASSHAAQCPRGAWANHLRPNPRLGCWTCYLVCRPVTLCPTLQFSVPASYLMPHSAI